MMSFEENVQAILDCNLTEVKDEVKADILYSVSRLYHAELKRIREEEMASYTKLQDQAQKALAALREGVQESE